MNNSIYYNQHFKPAETKHILINPLFQKASTSVHFNPKFQGSGVSNIHVNPKLFKRNLNQPEDGNQISSVYVNPQSYAGVMSYNGSITNGYEYGNVLPLGQRSVELDQSSCCINEHNVMSYPQVSVYYQQGSVQNDLKNGNSNILSSKNNPSHPQIQTNSNTSKLNQSSYITAVNEQNMTSYPPISVNYRQGSIQNGNSNLLPFESEISTSSNKNQSNADTSNPYGKKIESSPFISITNKKLVRIRPPNADKIANSNSDNQIGDSKATNVGNLSKISRLDGLISVSKNKLIRSSSGNKFKLTTFNIFKSSKIEPLILQSNFTISNRLNQPINKSINPKNFKLNSNVIKTKSLSMSKTTSLSSNTTFKIDNRKKSSRFKLINPKHRTRKISSLIKTPLKLSQSITKVVRTPISRPKSKSITNTLFSFRRKTSESSEKYVKVVTKRTPVKGRKRFILPSNNHKLAFLNKMSKCNIACPIFKRFGKCRAHERGICRRKHDKNLVNLCKKFLQGECHNENCLLSHNVCLEKMPTCKFYLNGYCDKDNCVYLHVKLNENTDVCKDFVNGFCQLADKCNKRHEFINCPKTQNNEKCTAINCPYLHTCSQKQYISHKRLNKDNAIFKNSKNVHMANPNNEEAIEPIKCSNIFYRKQKSNKTEFLNNEQIIEHEKDNNIDNDRNPKSSDGCRYYLKEEENSLSKDNGTLISKRIVLDSLPEFIPFQS